MIETENKADIIEQLIKTILSLCGKTDCSYSKNCRLCYLKISRKVSQSVNKNESLQFVLPAFPAKSANRDKTLSELPDMGERLGLRQLNTLLIKLKALYSPGAELVICSDGRVFNDVVGVSDQHVDKYRAALSDIVVDEGMSHISFFDLESLWPETTFTDMRKHLMKRYGERLEVIKARFLTDKNEKKLFNGLHRFLYEDLSYLYTDLSKNQLRQLAKQKTYQTIQRSHAWSNCIDHYFPEAIRLSIHPQTCDSEKLSFQLLPTDNRWATPWHNVVLQKGERFMLVKNIEAQLLGAKLVTEQGQPSHYKWEV